ncbi:pullulanase X25 domain-containing protein [Arthrobacter sp. CG_A4]|uniref:pullulanase X25 domain-containing protein n=1 Tax=Arthrobacter sp. CG_A4 TaxID=3071706 RepID=UPI002E086D37|nr:pyruvate/2-oxoglutarate dehydrogenase complex dihydrolipoamide acyltransferase (E2) component [Arthrobacter sp. CG_A4]
MGANTAENTNLRLKAVLDVLAEGVWTGEKLNAGAVLGEAIAHVPLNEFERELLSGGIPRGHKTLTTATAKLVKAGWLVKGRSGWSITDDGQRATVAFAAPAAFAAALDAGTPVPAGTPLPSAPAPKAAPKAAAAAEAPSKADPKVSGKAAPKAAAPSKAAKLVEEADAPVAKGVRKRAAAVKAPAKAAAKAHEAASAPGSAAAPAAAAASASVQTIDQPEAVAVVGDFNVLLGAPANWAPQYDEVQMELDLVDQLWKLAADLPAGFYSFKIALNRSWDENFGAFGAFDGANHEVRHGGGQLVIHYDHRTRDIILP